MSKKPTARAAKPQKAKTKTKPKGKAKSPSTKPTAEQLSDMDRQRLLMDHKRRIKPLVLAAKEAASDLREAYELAKSEGVPKKQIELAILLETDEGRTKVLGQFQSMIDVDRWMGKSIGTQLELFDKQSPKEAAFEQGRIAALNNEARRAPSHLSDGNAQHWMEGWGSGMAQVNKSRDTATFGAFKPLGEVAGTITPIDGAEAVDDLVDNAA
jgi:hypothetical protein